MVSPERREWLRRIDYGQARSVNLAVDYGESIIVVVIVIIVIIVVVELLTLCERGERYR